MRNKDLGLEVTDKTGKSIKEPLYACVAHIFHLTRPTSCCRRLERCLSETFIMGYKCCVSSCKSGYRPTSSPSSNSSVLTKKISYLAFPRNMELRKKCTRACHRLNFEPTENARVCSLHFEDNDFDTISSDTVTSRRSKHPILK